MTDKTDGPADLETTKKTYRVTCTLCGKKDKVPFRPKPDQDVFCGDCFKFKREGVQRGREAQAPRVKHNTRVMLPIQCALCGKNETLDYVPKGIALQDILCSSCVRSTHGEESRWAEISEKKVAEKQAEWSFDCSECGREDYLKFEPKPGEEYLCGRCFKEQEIPSPERLEGRKKVGPAVFIRKSKSRDQE